MFGTQGLDKVFHSGRVDKWITHRQTIITEV